MQTVRGTVTRVRGVRIGTLRRRHPAPRANPAPGPWPGDLTPGEWFARASLPLWVNGAARALRLRRLAFAVGCACVLTLSRALMAIG